MGKAKRMCNSIQVCNASAFARKIVIEPWALEYVLPSKSFCEVISLGDEVSAQIEVVDDEYGFVFLLNDNGFEYWVDGALIDSF